MNGDTLGTLVIALACVLALSVTASAVQDAVSTTPDDAIDLDTGSLPVSQEDAANIERKVQGNSDGSDEGGEDRAAAADPDSEASDAVAQSRDGESAERGEVEDAETGRSDSDRSDEERPRSGEDGADRERLSDGSGSGSGEGSDGDDSGRQGAASNGDDGGSQPDADDGSSGTQVREATLLERLFSLLADLLDRLLSALPLLALLIAAAFAAGYRDRILDRLRGSTGIRTADGSGTDDRVADPVPQHGVAEAWAELLDAIGRSRDPTASPAECAREAVDAGFDPDGVRTLREVYEEVRYGDAAVTRERERAAWEGLERSRGGRST